MRIWLVKEGEPLPCDNSGDRLFRMGLIAQTLSERGHEVVWWSSTFNHAKKVYRIKKDHCVQIASNYRIMMIHSISYKRNISIGRVVHQMHTAYKFAHEARKMKKPDVILCAMPTIDLSWQSVKYGMENGIPVILDIRDLWPDIYLDYLPAAIKPIVSLPVKLSSVKLKRACNSAFAIIGLTSEYLDWGLSYAGRTKTDQDKVFHLGYKSVSCSNEEINNGVGFWEDKGINSSHFVACFFGQIGHAADLDTVIRAASLSLENKRIKYVICGTGERLNQLKQKARGLHNVIFPGWVGAREIQSLMKISSVGIIPYKQSKNYEMNIPNKFAEYLSAGLPVLVSIKGLMKTISEENRCGFYYGTAEELADLMKNMEKQGNMISDMSENSKWLFNQMFKAENIYHDMTKYLEKIVCNKYEVTP